jgi:hypothetical protein
LKYDTGGRSCILSNHNSLGISSQYKSSEDQIFFKNKKTAVLQLPNKIRQQLASQPWLSYVS